VTFRSNPFAGIAPDKADASPEAAQAQFLFIGALPRYVVLPGRTIDVTGFQHVKKTCRRSGHNLDLDLWMPLRELAQFSRHQPAQCGGDGGDTQPKRRRSSITELAFHGIHTSHRTKAESVTHVSGTICHLCLGPLTPRQISAVLGVHGQDSLAYRIGKLALVARPATNHCGLRGNPRPLIPKSRAHVQ
jgi:hypothetical protein